MNKPLIVAALFAWLPLAAFAETPPQASAAALDAAPTATAAEPAAVAPTKPVKPSVADRRCLRETGSRISARRSARRDGGCLPVNGRSYSQEELQRTGAVDIADALRRLDPSIR